MTNPVMRTMLFGLALGLQAGCTWVSGKDVDGRRPEVDDDADGFVAADDCNDNDPAMNPDAVETWYDGVDTDCQGDDDYDADADGYVDDGYVGMVTDQVEGSGALPGGDCNDADAGANPAQADTWYDGVDTDCQGDDDYDADGDGYVPDDYVGLATDNAPGTGELPAGDCDDADADVSPAASDTWYDGTDSDCSGNDDYDKDGDGYVGDSYAGRTTTYVDGSGSLPAGDCDDDDDTIHPGATDTWYDGVDSNCENDDDFDADLDGYDDPSGGGDDCDDTDATSWPGNSETVGDGVDHDCDGHPDRFVLSALDSLTWSDPRDLHFDENSSTVFLSLIASQFQYGATSYYESGVAVTWDSSAPLDGETGIVIWLMNLVSPSYTLTDGHDFIADDDELVAAHGITYTSTGDRSLSLRGYGLATEARYGVNTPNASYPAFDDIQLEETTDGFLHTFACEANDGVGRYMRVLRTDLDRSYDTTELVPDMTASVCNLHFFDSPLGTLLTAQPDGLHSLSFDPTSDTPFADAMACPAAAPVGGGDTGAPGDTGVAGDTGSAGGGDTGSAGGGDTGTAPCPDPSVIDRSVRASDIELVKDKEWLLIADVASDQVVLSFPSGTELAVDVTDPMQAMATVGPDNTIYIAYVDGFGVPGLAWGTAALGFDQISFDPGFTVTEAAVEVSSTGENILFAVSGTDALSVGVATLY